MFLRMYLRLQLAAVASSEKVAPLASAMEADVQDMPAGCSSS